MHISYIVMHSPVDIDTQTSQTSRYGAWVLQYIQHDFSIDNRVGDWQQSRDPFRTRGPSEVVVFTPQKVSQGVYFLESITERFMMLCKGNC